MFRKILLSGISAVGLALPLASAMPADAREYHHHHDRDRGHDYGCYYECCYEVFYRDCCESPWSCYGRYESEFSARHTVRHLESRGYEVYMRAR